MEGEEREEEVGAMDLASDEDEPVEPADKVSEQNTTAIRSLFFVFQGFSFWKRGLFYFQV